MKALINWIKAIFQKIFTRKNTKSTSLEAVLPSNGQYIAWIESLERQIHQVKIDFALGWISKELYETNMEDLKGEVKELTDSYLRYLKQNNVSISKEIELQFS